MNYNFKNKEEYRKHLYDFAEKHVGKAPVLYLESSQALETLYLLKRGWNPKNLFPCNLSPAVAAHITRKVEKVTGERIKSLGKPVTDAVQIVSCLIEYMEGKEPGVVPIDMLIPKIVNLDFTGCLGEPVNLAILSVMKHMREKDILSITVLRGREPSTIRKSFELTVKDKVYMQALTQIFEPFSFSHRTNDSYVRSIGLSNYDLNRLGLILSLMSDATNVDAFSPRTYGVYKSSAGSQTMLFLTYQLCHEEDRETFSKKEKRLIDLAIAAERRGDRATGARLREASVYYWKQSKRLLKSATIAMDHRAK